MAIVLKEFEDIPYDWLEANYPEIKERLGFGYSDDRVKDNDEAMTDKDVILLQKECIKEYYQKI